MQPLREKNAVTDRLHILLIEDNPGDAELIREMIGNCETPCSLRTAERLAAGLRLLGQERFSAVFLDLGLPDSSGVETFLKLQQEAPDLPVIVLTGLSDTALASSAIALGAQDYLTKGKIDAHVLYRSALYSIERKRNEVALRERKELSEELNRLDNLIHSTLDLPAILERVTREATAAIGAEAAAIGLLEQGRYIMRAVANLPPELVGRSIDAREMKGIQHAASVRDVVVFEDAYTDDRINRDLVRMLGIRSLMVAPFVVKGTVLGAVSFYLFTPGRPFTDAQRDFGRKLSFSLSTALENSGLYAALRRSEQLARDRHSQLQAIYATAPVGLSFTDAALRYVQINRRMADLNGLPPEEHLGRTIREVLPAALADAVEPHYRQVIRSGLPAENIELQGGAGTNRKRTWLCSYYPVTDSAGRILGVNAVVQEITARKKMEEEIRHLANHDALTGLPNRRLFIELIALEKAQSRRHGTKLGVFFLDLDRFKIINDTLGHEAGDELLKEVASGLRTTVRSSDTVARIGGDEFNIIVPDIARGEDAGDVAGKITDYFSRTFLIAGQELHVTASVGISIFPDDSDDTDTLLRYADIAMYHAKEKGRNRFQFYDPEINVRSLERMRLESWLGQAVKRGELVIQYQPQVDIASRRILCAEALVRWNHPELGMLDPSHFIPLAEETGLIASIDEWVLTSVCRQARAWADVGAPSLCLTVNVSARFFDHPDLVGTITRILRQTRLPAGVLDLEITESTAMSNVERTASRLRELGRMGIHVSIDDFGTGYSSLNYLKRLPIQRIKIDRSFVQDIATDPDDRTIISAVTAMAHNMKMKVIAEGVETEEQLSFLRETGCDEMQGFLYSRPVTADRFAEMLAGDGLNR